MKQSHLFSSVKLSETRLSIDKRNEVRASFGFVLATIEHAYENGLYLHDLADGDRDPGNDWSQIRDSSVPQIEKMLARSVKFLYPRRTKILNRG